MWTQSCWCKWNKDTSGASSYQRRASWWWSPDDYRLKRTLEDREYPWYGKNDNDMKMKRRKTWKYCEVTARTSLCAGTILFSSQTRLTSAKRLVRLAKRRASKDDTSVSPPLQSPITTASLLDLGCNWDLVIIKGRLDLISWSLTFHIITNFITI